MRECGPLQTASKYLSASTPSLVLRISPIESIEQVKLTDSRIPFIGKTIIGQSVIKVKVVPEKLKLPSQSKNFEDRYIRRFTLTFNADASQIVSITSTFQGERTKDVVDEPSPEFAELQLIDRKKNYDSLPTERPKVTFLDALDQVLSKALAAH